MDQKVSILVCKMEERELISNNYLPPAASNEVELKALLEHPLLVSFLISK